MRQHSNRLAWWMYICLALVQLALWPDAARSQEPIPTPDSERFANYVARRVKTFVSQEKVVDVAIAAANQADPSKKPETPVISTSLTSLVEDASVSDLFSLAAFVTGRSERAPSPTSATVTAYALRAYAANADPLDPDFYQQNRSLRRLAFTVGYDAADTPQTPSQVQQSGILLGAKVLVLNRRDITAERVGRDDLLAKFESAVGPAGSKLSAIRRDIVTYLFSLPVEKKLNPDNRDIDRFRAKVENSWPRIKSSLREDELTEIDRIIRQSPHLSNLSDFQQLATQLKERIRQVRRAPRMSLDLQNKRRRGGDRDDYLGLVAYERGIGPSHHYLILNAAYGSKTSDNAMRNSGWRLAGQYDIPLNNVDVFDPKAPNRLSLAAEADRSGDKPIYRAQLKLTLPLRAGIEIPISITAANRTELIREGRVKGKVGITFDLGKIDYAKALSEQIASNPLVRALVSSPAPTPAPPAPETSAPAPETPTPETSTDPPAPIVPVPNADLRVQVQATSATQRRYLPAAGFTVEVVNAANVTVATGITDSEGLVDLMIPNYQAVGANFTLRVIYLGVVMKSQPLAGATPLKLISLGDN